jgi:hypothetical protein
MHHNCWCNNTDRSFDSDNHSGNYCNISIAEVESDPVSTFHSISADAEVFEFFFADEVVSFFSHNFFDDFGLLRGNFAGVGPVNVSGHYDCRPDIGFLNCFGRNFGLTDHGPVVFPVESGYFFFAPGSEPVVWPLCSGHPAADYSTFPPVSGFDVADLSAIDHSDSDFAEIEFSSAGFVQPVFDYTGGSQSPVGGEFGFGGPDLSGFV